MRNFQIIVIGGAFVCVGVALLGGAYAWAQNNDNVVPPNLSLTGSDYDKVIQRISK